MKKFIDNDQLLDNFHYALQDSSSDIKTLEAASKFHEYMFDGISHKISFNEIFETRKLIYSTFVEDYLPNFYPIKIENKTPGEVLHELFNFYEGKSYEITDFITLTIEFIKEHDGKVTL